MIRPFTSSDEEALQPIIKEFIQFGKNTYIPDVLDFDSFEDTEEAVNYVLDYCKKGIFLVAEFHKKVVGYIFGIIEEKQHRPVKKAGIIKSFFVSEPFRGKGLGKALYNALVLEFKEKDCDHLQVDTYFGNDRAIEMYKNWDFKEIRLQLKKKL